MNRARIRPLLALVLCVWMAVGTAGALGYARNYYAYRGFSVAHRSRGTPAGRVVKARFFSRSLGRERSYSVVLPAGYDEAAARGQRFPVLYMLHGTSGSPALFLKAGGLQVKLDELIAKGRIRPYLVVLPDGRDGTLKSDTEWANTRHGRYEGLVLDTVHAVDQRWATIPHRNARAIAGLSEGGYGAINIGVRHLGDFGALESWSGYFRQTATGPFRGAQPAEKSRNSPVSYVGLRAAQMHRLGLRVFLYGGARDPDSRHIQGFAAQLSKAGAKVTWAIYPGAHDWRVWRAQTRHMLQWAGSSFTHHGSVPEVG